MANLKLVLRLLLAIAAGCLSAVPSFADSQARIVRLAETQGDVSIDRNTGQGFEKAFLNLPITQGMKIQTGHDGRVALELEDGSTLRITPDTVLEVPELFLRDSGARVSTFHLQEGTAYVNFLGSKTSELTLSFAHQTVALNQTPARLRIALGDTDVTLAVFKGAAQVTAPSGKVLEISKGREASFDLVNDSHQLMSEIAEQPFDSWDQQQNQFQREYSSKSYTNYSPYQYGTSDLNYYGNFYNEPGYGSVWQPYFAGAGWNPFMDGAWAFNPGFGYGWVSGYPWGWTPYHYGSWVYLPTRGWVWQPGGAWIGSNTVPVVAHGPVHFNGPQPPSTPGLRLQPVNLGPNPSPLGKSSNHVQIPGNSAGLGIPRGSVRNLSELSHTAQQKGFATTTLHTGPTGFSSWLNSGYQGAGSHSTGSAGSRPAATSQAGSHSGGAHSTAPHR